jgi:nitrite reductase/ring-hydroxylating ferredoxin subunit
MIGFEKVAKFDEITRSYPQRVAVGDFECVLFRVGAQIFALENLCPHQRYSVFHQAVLDHYTLTCPMHGWSFDVRTGKAVTGSGHLKTFEVRVEKNDVWIKRPEERDEITSP